VPTRALTPYTASRCDVVSTYLSTTKHDEPVREAAGKGKIVYRNERRDATFIRDRTHNRHRLELVPQIKRRCRFIEQHQPSFLRQRSRDQHALALAVA
jgi:hypothetical protein